MTLSSTNALSSIDIGNALIAIYHDVVSLYNSITGSVSLGSNQPGLCVPYVTVLEVLRLTVCDGTGIESN